jgi:hypothetical protein
MLLTLAPNEQAEILGHAAGCTGSDAFYRGISTDPGLGQGAPSGPSGVRMARLTW